jgi:hypothetical protein
MTDDRMALMGALQKADDGNFRRALAETVLQFTERVPMVACEVTAAFS